MAVLKGLMKWLTGLLAVALGLVAGAFWWVQQPLHTQPTTLDLSSGAIPVHQLSVAQTSLPVGVLNKSLVIDLGISYGPYQGVLYYTDKVDGVVTTHAVSYRDIGNVTGTALNDQITGNSGNNVIEGGAGNDRLDSCRSPVELGADSAAVQVVRAGRGRGIGVHGHAAGTQIRSLLTPRPRTHATPGAVYRGGS